MTRRSVRLVRAMGSETLSDCRPITCGSFSSPANDVTSPTSAFVNGVVHVSCDSGHSLTETSYVHEKAYTCTSSGSHVVSASQGVEISNTPACYPVSCGVPPSVLNAIVDRTTAVTTWSSSDDCTTFGGTTLQQFVMRGDFSFRRKFRA